MNPNLVELIVKYFYLKEINNFAFIDIFDLLRLSVFFKTHELSAKILETLNENLSDYRKVLFINKNVYLFLLIFKKEDEERKQILKIIEECTIYLIKNYYFDDFLAEFDQKFLEKFDILIVEIFDFLIKILRNRVINDQIIQFIIVFRNQITDNLKRRDKLFNIELYFMKIVEENLDLTKIDLKDIDLCLKKLKFNEKIDVKDFSIIVLNKKVSENQRNISKLNDENLILRNQLKETQLQLNAFNEETQVIIKNLINENKRILGYLTDKISLFLFIHFPQFSSKELLFDSLKDDRNNFIDKIQGINNLIFF